MGEREMGGQRSAARSQRQGQAQHLETAGSGPQITLMDADTETAGIQRKACHAFRVDAKPDETQRRRRGPSPDGLTAPPDVGFAPIRCVRCHPDPALRGRRI